MDRKDQEELKPCPFCGKPVKYIGFRYHYDGTVIGHVVGCSGCCGWEMTNKSYKRLLNKANRRTAGA